MVETDVAGASSPDVDAQSGSAGSVSTKGSPEVAGSSLREATAAMRKRSESISHNDATDTPARGFFVSRERHGQDDSGDVTGVDGTPARVEGGGGGVESTATDPNAEGATRNAIAAREGGNPSADRGADSSGGVHEHAQPGVATDNSSAEEIDANRPAKHGEASNDGRLIGEGGGAAIGGEVAGKGSLGASVEEVPAMSDKGAVLATATDGTTGIENVGAGELVLPGGTVVLPGGDAAAESPAAHVAGTSGGLEPDSGSEEIMKEKEEAGGLPAETSAHSDVEKQPLAKTPVRVTDDREGVSPVTTDGRDGAAVERVADSSGVVAEAAAADALTAKETNRREDGVTPAPSEGVPHAEGLEQGVTKGSQVLTTGIEDGSEHLADGENVASSAGAPETSREVDAIVGEKDDSPPNDDVTVSGDASESPGETIDEQTVLSAEGGAGQGQGEVVKTEAVGTSVAGPVDLESSFGADGSAMESVAQAPGRLSNQSASEFPPGAASETPYESPNPVSVSTGVQDGAKGEGRGTAAVSEAGTDSTLSEQEGVSVGKTQGEKIEGGGADEHPVVADSEAGADVAGASGGEGADVGAAADVEAGAAAVAAVSEEEGRRARSKAKLGLARLQKGQTKKALLMFEKSASIDPGWWGGFYYTALGERNRSVFIAVCSTRSSRFTRLPSCPPVLPFCYIWSGRSLFLVELVSLDVSGPHRDIASVYALFVNWSRRACFDVATAIPPTSVHPDELQKQRFHTRSCGNENPPRCGCVAPRHKPPTHGY